MIDHYWRRWPESNVGIATGRGSGIVVLDVDSHRGGDDTLAELEAEYGNLPETIEAVTGRGGRHIYFSYPAGVEILGGSDRLGPGLDVLADRRLAIAPPSRHHSGRDYHWEVSCYPDEVSLAPTPGWVAERLTRRGDRRLADTVITAIPEGRRNTTLIMLAGAMRRAGFVFGAIRAALHEQNRTTCRPPLPNQEVEGLVRKTTRWPQPPTWITDPVGFIIDTRLGPRERILLWALTRHAADDGVCWPGYRRLNAITGIGMRRIRIGIDRLESAGRIAVLVRSRGGCRYRVIDSATRTHRLEGEGGGRGSSVPTGATASRVPS